MDHKELGALVGKATTAYYRGQGVDLQHVITDAIWDEMVSTRMGYVDGSDMQFGNRCSGQNVRILICTDEPPAVEEPDAVKVWCECCSGDGVKFGTADDNCPCCDGNGYTEATLATLFPNGIEVKP